MTISAQSVQIHLMRMALLQSKVNTLHALILASLKASVVVEKEIFTELEQASNELSQLIETMLAELQESIRA